MRVLVVEDSRTLADVLVEGLRDQGMAVDAAHDGLEAASKLELSAYDVVVLDRDLPGIHGDTLCQMITERDNRVMVLMLTAAGSPGDRVSGLGLGADDYLAKPFHFPELVLRIRSLARRQPSVRARILRAAGIELDPLRRTVTRDGRHVALSVKEFSLLEALLRASPAFLSAEDLLEQVWDEHADPFTNTVTVTIGRLRRKLGDPPVITTMPGVGYRMSGGPARSYPAAAAILAERDPVIRRLVAEAGPPRLSRTTETHFGTLVRAIVYQQLAGAAAAAIHGRLIAAMDGEATPERLLSLSDSALRSAGLSARKAESLRDLAAKVIDGTVVLDPSRLRAESDAEVIARLSSVRGIGTWTAQMFLLFQLRRLDVWPTGDLGVRKGYGLAWGIPTPTAKELDPLGDPYRPYRSVVAWYCWRAAELYSAAADSALTR